MTAPEIFCLESVGIEAWEIVTKQNRFAGMIVTNLRDGTMTHCYDSNGTKRSARKFRSFGELFANVDKRRARIAAKRNGG